MDPAKSVWLYECQTGTNVKAAVEPMNRESAKWLCSDWVEPNWWTISDFLSPPDEQPDFHWDWVALLSRDQNKPGRRAVCLRTEDGIIQGAMVYRIGVNSALNAEKKAVFVDRIATAPSNREELVAMPGFRGVGEALLRYAVAESWFYTLGGRVNLFPVANVGFYVNRNFQRTSVTDSETNDILYELSAEDAESWLRDFGGL